jgi:hypothetical protein
VTKEIAALRAGEPFDLDSFLSPTPPPSPLSKSGLDVGAHEEDDWENLNEFENLMERAPPERDELPWGSKRPSQEERYGALLNGPLKDAIAAICADRRLKPNWRLWTDNGFPPPPRRRGRGLGGLLCPNPPDAAAAKQRGRPRG